MCAGTCIRDVSNAVEDGVNDKLGDRAACGLSHTTGLHPQASPNLRNIYHSTDIIARPTLTVLVVMNPAKSNQGPW